MKKNLLACIFFLLCCSCETLILHIDGGEGQYDGKATIRDYITGYKYEVVKIDGQPVDRIQHGRLITRAPIIIIDPGRHTFCIQERVSDFEKQDGKTKPVQYVTAYVDSGREYFFMKLRGQYIIEEFKPEKQ